MSYRETLQEDYEFEVTEDEGAYEVSLPHQCDAWKILGFDGTDYKEGYGNDEWEFEGEKVKGTYPANPMNKELAIKQMELFVQRATEALDKLKQL